jgi:hypothetical protein
MQLNTRVLKKKLCLFGKFRGIRHLLVAFSALKISNLPHDFLDTRKYGCCYWWLGLDVVVVWCTLWNINDDSYCVTDRVKINNSRY